MKQDMYLSLRLAHVNVDQIRRLDYGNYKCTKSLIDKLVEKCSEDEILNRILLNATNIFSITDKKNVSSTSFY